MVRSVQQLYNKIHFTKPGLGVLIEALQRVFGEDELPVVSNVSSLLLSCSRSLRLTLT